MAGENTAAARHPKRRSARLALAIPALLFLLAFMVVPMALLVFISFQDADRSAFTLDRYASLLTSSTYVTDIAVTLGVALLTTALVLLLAYPAASLLVNAKRKWVRTLLYVVLVSPLLTSVVVRSFAWVVMLSQNGLVNQVLEAFGIISEPLTLLWNMGAVVLAYVQVLLPFAVLPLATSLGEVRPQLRQASMSLGAGRIRSFFSVVMPLTIPGAVNGGQLYHAAAYRRRHAAYFAAGNLPAGHPDFRPEHGSRHGRGAAGAGSTDYCSR